MKRECPMPARVFPLSISILFVASCGAMNSAQLAGGGGAHTRRARGTMPWNNAVEQCRAHQGRFHSPRCFSEARVRRKGSGAHGAEPGRQNWDVKAGDTEAWRTKLGGTKLGGQVWCALVSGQDLS